MPFAWQDKMWRNGRTMIFLNTLNNKRKGSVKHKKLAILYTIKSMKQNIIRRIIGVTALVL